jgi:RNA 3'-terminal phosphate cyclase (ATP)
VTDAIDLHAVQPRYKNVTAAYGPGNVILFKIQSEAITEVFSAFGKPGLPAEQVAQAVVKEVSEYLKSNVPVGKHLADQLLIPLALADQGSYLTQIPTSHTMTNIAVIKQFMEIEFKLDEIRSDAWLISLG